MLIDTIAIQALMAERKVCQEGEGQGEETQEEAGTAGKNKQKDMDKSIRKKLVSSVEWSLQ